MHIAIGCDHGGLHLKATLLQRLQDLGHQVDDVGTFGPESIDYPDYAAIVAGKVARGEVDRGVLVCGTGQGMAMAANKVRGVRAAVVSDPFSAQMASEHNDARVLCMGERVIGPSLAVVCLDAWLGASFEGGRHARRVNKISALEGAGPGLQG